MFVVLIVGASILWVVQAIGFSRLMNRRGFHPLLWFVVPLLLGPASWLLALLGALSGPPLPEVVRRGSRGTRSLDVFEVFVLLERDELPAQISEQLTRLMPYCHRLVLARVIRAGVHAEIKRARKPFFTKSPVAWTQTMRSSRSFTETYDGPSKRFMRRATPV